MSLSTACYNIITHEFVINKCVVCVGFLVCVRHIHVHVHVAAETEGLLVATLRNTLSVHNS